MAHQEGTPFARRDIDLREVPQQGARLNGLQPLNPARDRQGEDSGSEIEADIVPAVATLDRPVLDDPLLLQLLDRGAECIGDLARFVVL